jgi:hypothetical protein
MKKNYVNIYGEYVATITCRKAPRANKLGTFSARIDVKLDVPGALRSGKSTLPGPFAGGG